MNSTTSSNPNVRNSLIALNIGLIVLFFFVGLAQGMPLIYIGSFLLRIGAVVVAMLVLAGNVILIWRLLFNTTKGVPYVPSSRKQIRAMIALANITPKDRIVDLGAGHGPLLYAVEKSHTVQQLDGFEIDPIPLTIGKWVRWLHPGTKAKLLSGDMFTADLRQYTCVFVYLLPRALEDLRDKFQRELPKGARVISNTFHIPGMQPTRTWTSKDIPGIKPIHLYEF